MSGALSLLNEKKAAADGNVESPVKMQALQIELQLTKEALLSKISQPFYFFVRIFIRLTLIQLNQKDRVKLKAFIVAPIGQSFK